jgi:hypothetical protein
MLEGIYYTLNDKKICCNFKVEDLIGKVYALKTNKKGYYDINTVKYH